MIFVPTTRPQKSIKILTFFFNFLHHFFAAEKITMPLKTASYDADF